MKFFGKSKDKVKTVIKKITTADLRENLEEYNETVTQILIGMHSDIEELKNKIDKIENKNKVFSLKKITTIVYIALFLSLLSIIISIVK